MGAGPRAGGPRAEGVPAPASERADRRRGGRGESGRSRRRDREARGRQAPGRTEQAKKMRKKGPGAGSPGCSLAPSPQAPRWRLGAAKSRREIETRERGGAGLPGRWRRTTGIGSAGPGDPSSDSQETDGGW